MLACSAVIQPVPISCHFRGCKYASLSSIVSGAITSKLPLPFTSTLVPNLCVCSYRELDLALQYWTVCLSISPVRLFYQYVTNLSVNLVSGVTEL